MTVELLYFEDCPNYLPTLSRVRKILQEEGCTAEIREILVPDADTAQKVNFLGSPSVRVNGIDIESDMLEHQGFGFMCRCYKDGLPSTELIRTAIRSAMATGDATQ